MKKIITGAYTRFVTTCRKCGCVFEYELTDIVVDCNTDSPEVKCPRCGHYTSHYSCYGIEDSREEVVVKNENTCVCCGESIPEGTQVCPWCVMKKLQGENNECKM